jgi:hypothetical protein
VSKPPQSATSKSPAAANAAEPADTRVPPDPFAVVLPALAALGAVASIAAINWSAQDKTPDRAKSKRKAGVALRDLETCCMGLGEIFRRFQRNPRLFCGDGAPSSPLKFGVHGTRVGADDARQYQQLINDVASMLVLASQNAFDVMSAVEDGEIVAPEELYYGFGEQQERLNGLFQNRATLKAAVETGADIADALCRHVRELKSFRIE